MGESVEETKARYKAINFMSLPEVSKQAINKLEAEKCPSEELKILLVLAIAEGDEELAKKVLSETNKSLEKCWSHIFSWARKRSKGNYAALNSEDVCSEAIHYYLEVVEKAPVVAPKPTPKVIEPEIEDPVEDDGSMSLFGDTDDDVTVADDGSISLFD